MMVDGKYVHICQECEGRDLTIAALRAENERFRKALKQIRQRSAPDGTQGGQFFSVIKAYCIARDALACDRKATDDGYANAVAGLYLLVLQFTRACAMVDCERCKNASRQIGHILEGLPKHFSESLVKSIDKAFVELEEDRQVEN